MKLPDFLIIGTGRSGTTSLYEYLGQHPQIFMSPTKEAGHFVVEGLNIGFNGPGDETEKRRIRWSIEEYSSLFTGARSQEICGEAFPWYLYLSYSARNIKRYVPDVKMLCILRDPAERAYSAYRLMRWGKREPLSSFSEALGEENRRIESGWSWIWHYRSVGYYYEQLSEFYRVFDRDRIKVLFYDDLKKDPHKVLDEIYEYLGVKKNIKHPDVREKHMRARYFVSKNKSLERIIMKENILKRIAKRCIPTSVRRSLAVSLMDINRRPPDIPKHDREYLVNGYRTSILKLQDLVGKDLSGWLVV